MQLGGEVADWHPGFVRIELAGPTPLQRRELSADYHEDADTLVLDARCLRWASPLELAAIVTMAQDAGAQGRKVMLLMPDDPNVGRYLVRMNVVDLVETVADIDGEIPSLIRTDRSAMLLEVTGVTEGTANDVASKLGHMAMRQLDTKISASAFSTLGELLDNATTHGTSDVGAFTAAQLYTGASSGRPGFEFAVCDAGVGVLEHLRASVHYQDLEDDCAALECALRDGVSGTPTLGRGHGLTDLGDQATRNSGGRLMLRSGNAFASVVLRTRRPIVSGTVATPINGTWAWLRVRVT